MTALELATVEQIIEMDDVVQRNLRITHAYHELSERLRENVSGDHANWCTFAKWASKSVGRAVRGETVPAWLLGLLEESPAWAIGGLHHAPAPEWLGHWHRVVRQIERTHAIAAFDALLATVSARLAAGNLKVFAELGPVFTRFCDAIEKGGDPRLVIATIPALEEDEDLSWLHAALEHYLLAGKGDPADRAQHVFAGNVLVGLHEQTRLQSAIAGALDAPFDPSAGALLRHPEHGHSLRRFWEHEITIRSVLLATPEGGLHPGADLPAPPGCDLYPAELAEIRLAEALELVERWDRSDGHGRRTAASNWTRLDDRMNFILNLFRSRHAAGAWHAAPFTAEQAAAIEQGRLPEGEF